MKTILVTGGAGFIGSNFVRLMLNEYPEYRIINIDALTYAGNTENLKDISNYSNYFFEKVDIRNKQKVESVFKKYDITYVVNFAAESHVDRSIEDPEMFLMTNVLGTQVLLEVAKNNWKIEPNNNQSREYKKDVKFIQISTDEVYGSLGKSGKFVETMPLKPNNPYSASKASADMVVRAYHKTYGLPINITRCSNNYGPYQFPEKLIPFIINQCLNDKELTVYGSGLQVRDWIHVEDHCRAIAMIINKGKDGEIYNVGSDNQRTNIEVIKLIIKMLGKTNIVIKHIEDRPGHDYRYAIDNTKITKEIGWKPRYNFEQGIKDTIKWYVENLIYFYREL